MKLGMLAPGKYRELTPSEVNALRAAAGKGKVTAEIAKNAAANAARTKSAHGVRAPKPGRPSGPSGAREAWQGPSASRGAQTRFSSAGGAASAPGRGGAKTAGARPGHAAGGAPKGQHAFGRPARNTTGKKGTK